MLTAIELGVDADEFRFENPAEPLVWADLAHQLGALADKDDVVWLHEAA
jgi:hypothetical protein